MKWAILLIMMLLLVSSVAAIKDVEIIGIKDVNIGFIDMQLKDSDSSNKINQLSIINKNSDTTTFLDILPNTDIEYIETSKELKETIILKSVPDYDYIKYEINTNGRDYSIRDSGIWVFENGEPIYLIEKPFFGDNIYLPYTYDGLNYVIDIREIQSEKSFPVYVDPTVVFINTSLYRVYLNATSLTASDYLINDCGTTLISPNLWQLKCLGINYEISRAKALKTLFYGTNGGDPRVNRTNPNKLMTNDLRDISRSGFYFQVRAKFQTTGWSYDGESLSQLNGTFSDTSTNWNISSWSYINAQKGGADAVASGTYELPYATVLHTQTASGTSDETGTNTSGDEKANQAKFNIEALVNYNAADVNKDVYVDTKLIMLSKGTLTYESRTFITPLGGTGTTVWADNLTIDFLADYGIPVFTSYSELLYINLTDAAGSENLLSTNDLLTYARAISNGSTVTFYWRTFKDTVLQSSGSIIGNSNEKVNIVNISNVSISGGDTWIASVSLDNISYYNVSALINFNSFNIRIVDASDTIINTLESNLTGIPGTIDNPIIIYKSNYSDQQLIYINISDTTGFFNPIQTNFTLDYADDNITIVLSSKVISINLFDERTLGIFNISSTDNVFFLVFCPSETYQYEINATNFNISIPCDEDKFKFEIEYGTTSYTRSFIISSVIRTMDVYLMDLSTTQAIYSSFKLDDLNNDYDNPTIWFYKFINSTKTQILADAVDAEDKVAAYLIENAEYNIEVCSTNLPCKDMGIYVASDSTTKILRLYDVIPYPQITGFSSTVRYNLWSNNDTGTLLGYGLYNDSVGVTTSVKFSLYLDESGGPLIYSDTTTDQYKLWSYDISAFSGDTVVGELIVNYAGEERTFAKTIYEDGSVDLAILAYISQDWINMFITILLGVIALLATIKTGPIMTLFIWSVAALFAYFKWYSMPIGIIGLTCVVIIVSFLKHRSGRGNTQ